MSATFVQIEGAKELYKQFKALGGKDFRRVMRLAIAEQMAPVLPVVKSRVPTHAGRLLASIGRLQKTKKSWTRYEIGTTGDFNFTGKRSGIKMYQAKGEKRKAAMAAKGYTLDKTSPNLYAGGIEFGTKKSGAVARKAGGAGFLNPVMEVAKPRILNNITASYIRFIDFVVRGKK
jgi:hypothetical protein